MPVHQLTASSSIDASPLALAAADGSLREYPEDEVLALRAARRESSDGGAEEKDEAGDDDELDEEDEFDDEDDLDEEDEDLEEAEGEKDEEESKES
jgi:hypothetical protein